MDRDMIADDGRRREPDGNLPWPIARVLCAAAPGNDFDLKYSRFAALIQCADERPSRPPPICPPPSPPLGRRLCVHCSHKPAKLGATQTGWLQWASGVAPQRSTSPAAWAVIFHARNPRPACQTWPGLLSSRVIRVSVIVIDSRLTTPNQAPWSHLVSCREPLELSRVISDAMTTPVILSITSPWLPYPAGWHGRLHNRAAAASHPTPSQRQSIELPASELPPIPSTGTNRIAASPCCPVSSSHSGVWAPAQGAGPLGSRNG